MTKDEAVKAVEAVIEQYTDEDQDNRGAIAVLYEGSNCTTLGRCDLEQMLLAAAYGLGDVIADHADGPRAAVKLAEQLSKDLTRHVAEAVKDRPEQIN